MKLAAEVKRVAVSGINKIFVGYLPTGEQQFEDMSEAIRVEIEVTEDGTCFFFRYGINDVFCGDSWFETLEGAKRQGAFEYDISEAEWSITEPGLERLSYKGTKPLWG